MTEERRHRCFIAVPVAERLRKPLKDLRRLTVPGGARAVPEANLHLTLVFLGALSPEQLRRAAALVETLPVSPAPELQPLTRAGGFPGPRSRMVAVEGKPTPAMTALVSTLRAALKDARLPAGDDRAPRPHITLAKRPRGGPALPDHSCELWLPVEEMVLYESLPVPGGNGVEYRPLTRRSL